MKCEFSEEVIDRFHEEERRRRNEELRRRVMLGKSFEDMLFELAALGGLNVRERACAAEREQVRLPA